MSAPRVRRAAGDVLRAAISLLTAIALATVTLLGQASAAFAATAPASVAPAASAPSADGPASPGDGSLEIVSRRSETATHYRMPDGIIRAVLSDLPVRFKDGSGVWQPVDDTLVPGQSLGESRNAAGPLTTQFASAQTGTSDVRIARDGWEVGLGMLDAAPGIRLDSGSTASYLGVAAATTLIYQPSAVGLKETVVLASADAPSTLRFRLSTRGATLRREASGGWVVVAAGVVVLRMAPLMIADSSKTSAGIMAPRRCASMRVEPAPDGAIITYEISRAWMWSALKWREWVLSPSA